MNQTSPSTSEPTLIPRIVTDEDLFEASVSRENIYNQAKAFLEGFDRESEVNAYIDLVQERCSAARMAGELADYHEAAANGPFQSENSIAYHNKLAGYARQLEAAMIFEVATFIA